MTTKRRSPPSAGIRRVLQHIDGQWSSSQGGREYQDSNPWTGEPFAMVVAGDAEDTTRAIEAAHRAFPSWANQLPGVRQLIFLRAAEILAGRRAQLLHDLAAETGCGQHFATVQIDFAASLLRQAAALPYQSIGQLMPSDVAGTTAMAVRRPVGVVGAIAPWNASLILSGRAIVGPLALGNTVVLKPSEDSPYTGGTVWAEIFIEAGLPPEVLNVVTHAPGEAGMVGGELMAHPLVRRINFTGSTATGRRLAEAAGRHLKRMVLQLSGQNPLLVLADADVDYAVDAAAYGAFVHQGQICMCVRRIYVERGIAEEFTQKFVHKVRSLHTGDPLHPDTVVGPVINKWALALIGRRVDEAVALGARVLVGGTANPPCYPATVLTDVPAEAEIAVEETFGPVVILQIVDDAPQAIALANHSQFGLTASILTGDTQRGLSLARNLDAGIVHVNDQSVNDEPQMPFGGVKDSGWGRFGIGFSADEFTDLQWVTSRTDPRTFAF